MITEIYHMYDREIIIVIASIFLFIICRSFNSNDKRLVKLVSQPIYVPFSQMEKICGDKQSQNMEIQGTNRYKLIHYIDTESCSVCELKAMYQWDDFLIKTGLEKSVQLYCIIDTRNHNRKELMKAINETNFQCEVYFDSTGIFHTTNNFISAHKVFYTFLLDRNNNVVMVGNPLNNPKIRELLVATIDNLRCNDNACIS